jgi:HlyD family secretion protein
MNVADRQASARRDAAAGPQGEALILELRRARRILDRSQHGTSREETHGLLQEKVQGIFSARIESRRPQSASPERLLRQVSGTSERLDRFDRDLLHDPIPVIKTEERIRPERDGLHKQRLLAGIEVYLQTVRAHFGWLLTGAPVQGDLPCEFAEHVVRRHELELKAALRVLLVSAVIGGGWATLIPLSGAVVLPGTLVVESSVKKIQHPTGGVVTEIPVHDGMHVSTGTLLARLDQTQVQASQQLVANQLDQVRVRIARLVAERDASNEIQLPQQLTEQLNDLTVAPLVASETSLFNARASARQGQKDLYQSNIHQFEEQIDGLGAEIKSKSSQLDLIASELAGVQGLFAKGLVPLTRMTTLQRESARLEGERAQLTATIAETKAKIGQAQLQIVQIDQNFRSEVMKDLRESQDKEAELMERNVAAKDQLNRIDIRSPTSGIVHQLTVHTIGGVVRPGDVIMEIVPDSDALEIEGRLPPNEIDQVAQGQQANLRFSTLDRQTMPQARGTVTYVSADLSRDEQTNARFYTVRIDLPIGERHRLNGLTLVSGMPVEIFLQTGSRTMLSYLFKPITDQFRRMFNEP